MRNVSDKIKTKSEKIKIYFEFSKLFFSFFRKSCRLWEKVEKCCREWQVTDDDMAHAHCILDA